MTSPIFTIGHSTHPVEKLIELLLMHDISVVCDVRSKPYSRMNPQFNREELKDSLKQVNIKYVFLGKELGARSEDKGCYRNGQVQYDLLAQTKLFHEGIRRLKKGANDHRIALMCAEKEPLECHRTILVSRKLFDDGLSIKHILSDGQIEDHAHAIERLIARLRVPSADMFRSHDAAIADAYAQQGNEIAYREDTIDSSASEASPHHGAAE
jgi:uncharacterized protein (DUF488 family)